VWSTYLCGGAAPRNNFNTTRYPGMTAQISKWQPRRYLISECLMIDARFGGFVTSSESRTFGTIESLYLNPHGTYCIPDV
jgi:hypothetical protein